MKNILILILIILLIILVVLNAHKSSTKPSTVTIIDTAYITKTNTVVKKVLVHSVDTSYDTSKDVKFIPDTSYKGLKKQFETLSKEITKKTIYKDTLLLDSIGYVHVSDTVQFNTLVNREYKYSYKLPIVTKTITHYPGAKRQLYFGGGLNSTSVYTGLIYKTKKDRLIGVNIGLQQSKLTYGFQTFIPLIK